MRSSYTFLRQFRSSNTQLLMFPSPKVPMPAHVQAAYGRGHRRQHYRRSAIHSAAPEIVLPGNFWVQFFNTAASGNTSAHSPINPYARQSLCFRSRAPVLASFRSKFPFLSGLLARFTPRSPFVSLWRQVWASYACVKYAIHNSQTVT